MMLTQYPMLQIVIVNLKNASSKVAYAIPREDLFAATQDQS